jgi:hypothetical protein
MSHSARSQTSKPGFEHFCWFLLCVVAGTLTCGQAPLYYSNQHQYLLHGLAQAGSGQLARDWLANTVDPTPLFTVLIKWTVQWTDARLIHVYYALLIGLYFASLIELGVAAVGRVGDWNCRWVLLALLLLVHSAAIRWASYRVFGQDYSWYLQAGVAGQYVLGAMFQPSVFGVLLIAALWQFTRQRHLLAVLALAIASAFHSTYLLHAGLLALGMGISLWRSGAGRDGVRTVVAAVFLLAPTAAAMLWRFQPTSKELLAQAQHILVHVRIPHHCLPALWCDGIAIVQLALMGVSLPLLHRQRLFVVVMLSAAGALALTLMQLATGSDALALLFPWRISAVLVPMAMSVLIAQILRVLPREIASLSQASFERSRLHLTRWVSIGLVFAFSLSGSALMLLRQGYQQSPEEESLLAFVRENALPGDVYLLPVQMPNLKATTRGSLSSDFKPAAAKQRDARLIPIDLQRFRLSTGAPIYVDFKSIPYKDTEVLEWQRRMWQVERWNRQLSAGRLDLDELRREGITHIVQRAGEQSHPAELVSVYEDSVYRVLQLRAVR